MDHQLQTINIYNQYVKEYLDKFIQFDLYNDTFEQMLSLLPENSSVVELGCGPGNVIKYLSGKRPDLKFLGIDLAPEMLKQAKILNPNADFRMMDIRNFSELDNKFDCIIGAFCLPYLSYEDLPGFFSSLKMLTTPSGIIYISCMEGEKEKTGFEKTSFTGESEIYIYYHQRDNLEKHIIGNGFTIENFYTKDYPEPDGSVTTDLVYIARKI